MDPLLRSALPLSVNLNRYATKVATHIEFLWNVRVMSFTVNNQFLISLFVVRVLPCVLDDDPSLTTTALPLSHYTS